MCERSTLKGFNDEEFEINVHPKHYVLTLLDNGICNTMVVDKEKFQKFIKEVMGE